MVTTEYSIKITCDLCGNNIPYVFGETGRIKLTLNKSDFFDSLSDQFESFAKNVRLIFLKR